MRGHCFGVTVRRNQAIQARGNQRAGVRLATSERVLRFSPGSEAAFDRHAEAAAGFHDRKDRGDFRSSLRAAHMQPVLASEAYGPHRVLRQVIGQLHFRVVETPPQLRPHICRRPLVPARFSATFAEPISNTPPKSPATTPRRASDNTRADSYPALKEAVDDALFLFLAEHVPLSALSASRSTWVSQTVTLCQSEVDLGCELDNARAAN
jgi:hypothetical protein